MIIFNQKSLINLKRGMSLVALSFFCINIFLGNSIFFSLAHAVEGQDQYIDTLPAPGKLLHSSDAFNPAVLRGFQFSPSAPFHFTFYLDAGNSNLTRDKFENQAQLLIKYFLTALTTREDDLWVNLSPREKNRIVPEPFGQTELGRDLLAQDYLLKQLVSSLMYPEEKVGQEFWQRVYQDISKITQESGESINTLNRVWIVPDKATVYRNGNKIFIANCRLKVLSAEDYSSDVLTRNIQQSGTAHISQDALKDIIIPKIEQEVNEGESFSLLRQIYYSVILAEWYKKHLANSILGEKYVEKNKVNGLNSAEIDIKHKIYERYLEAYQKGIYNYIREDFDSATQSMIPRKYFSGGVKLTSIASSAILTETNNPQEVDPANGETYEIDAVLEPTKGQQPSSLEEFLRVQEDSVNSTGRYVQEIPKAATPVTNDELPREYYLRVSQMTERMLQYIKEQNSPSTMNTAMSDILKDIAMGQLLKTMLAMGKINSEQYFNKRLVRKHLSDEQRAILERADAVLQQLKSQSKSSRWYFADFGTVLAAFLGEQAIYGQNYFNVYLPRDMGYGYTIQRTLSELGTAQAQNIGIFYLSRASFGKEYYDWFKKEVLALIETVKDRQEFMERITEIVKKRMANDESFKNRMEELKAQIDQLGYGNKQRVRFIDSSTGRFPTLFQVLFRLYYPDVETAGLVIQSFDEKLLPQLSTNEWRQEIKDQISSDRGLSQILADKVAARMEQTPAGSGQARRSFFHPIQYDEQNSTLETSPLHEILMADWIAIAFIMGTARYYLMVSALQTDLIKQGMETDKAETVTVKAIPRIVSETKAEEDKAGVMEAVVDTNPNPPSILEVNQLINDLYVNAGGQKHIQFRMPPELYGQIAPPSQELEQTRRNLKGLIIGLMIALSTVIYFNYERGPVTPTQVLVEPSQPAITPDPLAFIHTDILSLGATGPAFDELKSRVFEVFTTTQLSGAVSELSSRTNPLTGKAYSPQFKQNANTIVGKSRQAGRYTQDFEVLIIALQEKYNIRPDGDVGPETRELVRKLQQGPPKSSTSKSSSTVGGIAFSRDVSWITEMGSSPDLLSSVIPQKLQELEFDGLTPVIIGVNPVELASEILQEK